MKVLNIILKKQYENNQINVIYSKKNEQDSQLISVIWWYDTWVQGYKIDTSAVDNLKSSSGHQKKAF